MVVRALLQLIRQRVTESFAGDCVVVIRTTIIEIFVAFRFRSLQVKLTVGSCCVLQLVVIPAVLIGIVAESCFPPISRQPEIVSGLYLIIVIDYGSMLGAEPVPVVQHRRHHIGIG